MTGSINQGPSLPTPFSDISSSQGNQAETAPAKVEKAVAQMQDQISKLENFNEQIGKIIDQEVFHFEGADSPVPQAPSQQGRDALGRVGGAGDSKDAAGRGNPWLTPNPLVAVQIAMMELYSIMRESNLGMAKYENTTMALTIQFAETAASLIIQSAEAEAHMAMLEAVAAGISMGASALSFGISAGSFAHSQISGGKAISQKETEIETQKPITDAKQKEYEAADAKYKPLKQEMDSLQEKKIKLQTELDDLKSGQSVSAGTKQRTEAQVQTELNEVTKKIDTKKDLTASMEKERNIKFEEFKHSKEDLQRLEGELSSLKNNQFQTFNNITQMAGMLNQVFGQGAQAITKGLSISDIEEKGQAQARQQVVEALAQVIKQSGQSVDESQRQGRELMNSLIQALDKVSEMMHKLTLSHNG